MNRGQARQRPVRLLRSMLFVPATSERFFAKAITSDADGIIFDLEDSVPTPVKARAREVLLRILRELDFGKKTIAVRINGIESGHMYQDVISLAEQCSRLDFIIQPKVEHAWHVQFLSTLLDQIERLKGTARSIGIEAIIETPLGIENLREISNASPRLETLSFGAGDYAAAMGMKDHVVGAPDATYCIRPSAEFNVPGSADQFGDKWHYAMAKIANCCHAYGLRARDSAYADLKNQEGFRAAALRARALGFEGKSVIHPSQIASCNQVFSPSANEVAWATNVLKALQQAAQSGDGAVSFEGEMVDEVHVKSANRILEEHRLVMDGTRTAEQN